jgi:small-conductance mechanosensitive channel
VVDQILELLERPDLRAAAIAAGSIVAAFMAELVLRVTLLALARRTRGDLDDQIVQALRRPIFLSIVLAGLAWSAATLELGERALSAIHAFLATLAVLIWAGGAFRISTAILEALSSRAGDSSVLQPRTLPIFEILIRIAVIGAAIYFTFLAWRIDLTAWLASAGIIGIAVGFAAKDTLANFFAGIFIIADAPYKVGDWIVLDGELRGRVTRIGIRSTRILTTDDLEITVPNAVIGNSKILNEAGGPSIKHRIRIKVSCAYGSDIDLVRRILERCCDDMEDVSPSPPPAVRFTAFGDSGLEFELLVWLDNPARREPVIDTVNCRIYKKFAENKIEIPYPKRDVYIKQIPPGQAPPRLG